MKSLFFDSIKIVDPRTGEISYDRPASAADFRSALKSIFTNGIVPNTSDFGLVQAGSGMTTTVQPSEGWLQGSPYKEVSVRTMLHDASTSQDRIDRVIVRFDDSKSQRDIDLYVLKGIPSASPVAPTLTRNATQYEQVYADVLIKKNSTSISNSQISDKRTDPAVCGIVTGVFTQLDMTSLNAQYEAWFDETKTDSQVAIDQSYLEFTNYIASKQAQINEVLRTQKRPVASNLEVTTSGWQASSNVNYAFYKDITLVGVKVNTDGNVIASPMTGQDKDIYEIISDTNFKVLSVPADNKLRVIIDEVPTKSFYISVLEVY